MKKDTMMQSLTNKTGYKFDKAFLSAMIMHHKDAVKMSNLALKNSSRKEILKLAHKIIKAQTKEIEQMKEWKSEWK